MKASKVATVNINVIADAFPLHAGRVKKSTSDTCIFVMSFSGPQPHLKKSQLTNVQKYAFLSYC